MEACCSFLCLFPLYNSNSLELDKLRLYSILYLLFLFLFSHFLVVILIKWFFISRYTKTADKLWGDHKHVGKKPLSKIWLLSRSAWIHRHRESHVKIVYKNNQGESQIFILWKFFMLINSLLKNKFKDRPLYNIISAESSFNLKSWLSSNKFWFDFWLYC